MKKILKLISSIVVFIAGIMMIVYQYSGKKEYIYFASVAVIIFGLLHIIISLYVEKD